MVRSVRGAQGGYRLTRPVEEYTVGAILRLMEGSLAPVACLECNQNDCERSEFCDTLEIWKELYEAINAVVDKYTLQDLVEIHQKKAEIHKKNQENNGLQ